MGDRLGKLCHSIHVRSPVTSVTNLCQPRLQSRLRSSWEPTQRTSKQMGKGHLHCQKHQLPPHQRPRLQSLLLRTSNQSLRHLQHSVLLPCQARPVDSSPIRTSESAKTASSPLRTSETTASMTSTREFQEGYVCIISSTNFLNTCEPVLLRFKVL